jgi:hypothetical protein
MREFIRRSPLLVVKSETFFAFTRRRMKEGQNVLLDLARYRPSNFGISTAILMHIIRYVCHTPVVKQGYLRDGLRDVRFEEIITDYGMFFLHDLDLEHHCITSIPAKDPDGCKVAMSLSGKLPKLLGPAKPANTAPTGLYPLGDSPSWGDIRAFIGRGANIFMKGWVWDLNWDEEDNVAGILFTRFTREYFATLKLDAVRADLPSPITLEGAMGAWTVDELNLTLISCWFIASNHGLDGKFAGARHMSFREHAETFFPSSTEHITDSTWRPFLDYGYIGEYHRTLNELSEGEGESLKNSIASIFGRLQCLPVAVAPSRRSKGKVWTATQDGVHFLTNPIFYKLNQVGSGVKAFANATTNRLQRVKASNTVINKRFIEMNGGRAPMGMGARKARRLKKQRMSRLSIKTKNKRKPPMRKRQEVVEDADEESESEDSTEMSDEEGDEDVYEGDEEEDTDDSGDMEVDELQSDDDVNMD